MIGEQYSVEASVQPVRRNLLKGKGIIKKADGILATEGEIKLFSL